MTLQQQGVTGSPGGASRPNDAALRRRAAAVIPGGMYGHLNMASLPADYPQFFESARGARVTDVDGREFVDLMCSWGPVLLGHHHPEVDEAVARQAALGDCLDGPSARMVELAERLTGVVTHAQWAMFEKNGTDATTLCCVIARAATGRRKILVAQGAYHGAAPWCTPVLSGTTAEDRANVVRYVYNDLESVREVLDDDVAAVLVSPYRHDAGFDQELVDPAFAQGLRDICDELGAALILDDVRCGLRLEFGGSWQAIGVEPDLSAWSKAIANGYPLAAVLGNDKFRTAATTLFTTGSFWFASVAMAASLATLDVMEREDSVGRMRKSGEVLRAGIAEQAQRWGFEVLQTGPPQMPYMSFVGDQDYERALGFAAGALRNGLFLHPRHNWFISAALTSADLDVALAATDAAFGELRHSLG